MTPDEIRAGVDAVREWVDEYPEATVLALWEARAWTELGYETWDALVAGEWSRSIVLPRPERREVVGRLRQEGMSTRAIAAAVGVHHSTVADDLATVGNPTVDEVTSLDGRTRPATRPQPEPEPVEVLTSQDWEARQGIVTEPDPDDFIPAQTKFELSFWRHMDGAHELVTDLDYPHHFNEQMTRRLLDLINTLARKQDALNARGLRVVNGGKQ